MAGARYESDATALAVGSGRLRRTADHSNVALLCRDCARLCCGLCAARLVELCASVCGARHHAVESADRTKFRAGVVARPQLPAMADDRAARRRPDRA